MKTLLSEIWADLKFFRCNPEIPLVFLCFVIMVAIIAMTGCADYPLAIRVQDAKSGLSVEFSTK